jgi:hypothetical protein
MQAFILRQICRPDSDYDFAWGRTYYATLCRIIPSFVWEDRPLLKNFEGTEIQYGKGSFDPVRRKASQVYLITAVWPPSNSNCVSRVDPCYGKSTEMDLELEPLAACVC